MAAFRQTKQTIFRIPSYPLLVTGKLFLFTSYQHFSPAASHIIHIMGFEWVTVINGLIAAASGALIC